MKFNKLLNKIIKLIKTVCVMHVEASPHFVCRVGQRVIRVSFSFVKIVD